ncbi:predicted protein [Streptomyces viridochromogenes DSM 40736]|uniref:Predicted protein n=1 Tax=Streptomyces viridochromogenes (strain DSM 40736 / JCM 4977 / BCRC 1201 / Tue 494) TaxID=591159 RepID=D9X334_STRVT|nr:hypothetical protein [Streptomyces viridochromogenes]EFL29550.1 predicted protein [Streptomyces viridochromogenes DSM 40736]
MRTRIITTTAVLLLALTACSSDATSRASEPAAQTSTAEPKPSPDKPRAFGQELAFTDDGMTMGITVLGHEQDTFHPQTSADEESAPTATRGQRWRSRPA